MKKLFVFFSFIAMTVAAVSFTSCDKTEDDTPIIDPTPTVNYAKYAACINEEFLKYGEMTVTFEANNETKTYKMSEAKKTKRNFMTYNGHDENVDIRELVIPVFEVKSKNVKATVKIELTEAGKKLCAAANDEDELDFALLHILGYCDAKGDFLSSETVLTNDTKKFSIGLKVKDLPAYVGLISSSEKLLSANL